MTQILEREKYEQMWRRDEYRVTSPGEECAQLFLGIAKPKAGASVLDLGCGTGRGGFMLALLGGMNVTLVDFASNCLDEDIVPMMTTQAHTLRFVEADLTKRLPVAAEYGYCCDVLEHIPSEHVGAVLDNCLLACQHCYFQIATEPDVMGALIGHPLHLSVHPYAWWLERFRERECVIHWSADCGNACRFYVTAWQDGQSIVDVGVLNLEEEQVLQNVRTNCAGGWKQVEPHPTNDFEIMILGGGPSLNDKEQEIRDLQATGVKIVTLNGAYNWCQERGIGPVTQVMVDARPFNARFVQPIDDRNMYLIASQCNPGVFVGLPTDRTFIWHTSAEFIHDALNGAYPIWWGVPGGSTVLLRAIPLLRMLGYRKMHLFGCDSCLSDGEHHAYLQDENATDVVLPVTVEGRVFQCQPWMASQATEFMALVRNLGDELELTIHGDGLLAWIVQSGYNRWQEKRAAWSARRQPKTRSRKIIRARLRRQ